jgi:hypothetical protein
MKTRLRDIDALELLEHPIKQNACFKGPTSDGQDIQAINPSSIKILCPPRISLIGPS